jgi:hypothetical protein
MNKEFLYAYNFEPGNSQRHINYEKLKHVSSMYSGNSTTLNRDIAIYYDTTI